MLELHRPKNLKYIVGESVNKNKSTTPLWAMQLRAGSQTVVQAHFYFQEKVLEREALEWNNQLGLPPPMVLLFPLHFSFLNFGLNCIKQSNVKFKPGRTSETKIFPRRCVNGNIQEKNPQTTVPTQGTCV